MAAVMLHSLSFIDRDEGETAAAEVYRQAERLVNSLGGWSGWRVNLTWHEFAPKLLGLEPLPDAQLCAAEQRPRFYVYDTGDYARPLLSCASGMEGSEVMLHRFLLRSRCRTRDPAEADFFYVPFYSFCFQNLHIKPGTETEELDKHNIAVVNSLEYFDVYRRRQHIFHFAHEFWDFPSWESYVARAKIFAVEANPLIDVVNYRHCVSCFDAWKDVVVPGHTDAWAMRKLREKGKPSTERRFRFCFHGAMRHDLYERTHAEGKPFNGSRAADTRRQIQAFAGESDASIGPHITPLLDYYGRVGDCMFCLVPKGVGYTNGRLFEAFFAGCIPVILSDAMLVPFQASGTLLSRAQGLFGGGYQSNSNDCGAVQLLGPCSQFGGIKSNCKGEAANLAGKARSAVLAGERLLTVAVLKASAATSNERQRKREGCIFARGQCLGAVLPSVHWIARD
ncbi:IRX10 [Symbiodinium necroappetens]|uniref:IRX10 protein n=1 Tax=Symbiodinium necroappetens TaxID=1628268 RepID=A0A812SWM0_9DINO|nr:IRX10 [Symbiodinium necroappetens]